MSRPGKTWNHLPKHASLEEIGWNIQDIKKWREREHNNGKASRLDDFFFIAWPLQRMSMRWCPDDRAGR